MDYGNNSLLRNKAIEEEADKIVEMDNENQLRELEKILYVTNQIFSHIKKENNKKHFNKKSDFEILKNILNTYNLYH